MIVRIGAQSDARPGDTGIVMTTRQPTLALALPTGGVDLELAAVHLGHAPRQRQTEAEAARRPSSGGGARRDPVAR